MVQLALPLIALATAASAVAVPAATSGTTFSFAQWVEDIIAHPDTALTPDEAVAAAQAADVVGSAGGLKKRVNCDQPWASANGVDAAACVDYLARLGALGYDCYMEAKQYSKTMCIINRATIVGSKAISTYQAANCNDYARTAGIIFDNCYRSGGTVLGSEYCITNTNMQVNVHGL